MFKCYISFFAIKEIDQTIVDEEEQQEIYTE